MKNFLTIFQYKSILSFGGSRPSASLSGFQGKAILLLLYIC